MGKRKCGECIYRAHKYAPYSCNYATITGKTRKAVPPEKCRKFKAGERMEERDDIVISEDSSRKPAQKPVTIRKPKAQKRKRSAPPDWELGMRLWKAGMNDREIGENLGVCASAVLQWRQRNGLPANASQGWDCANKKKKERRVRGNDAG